MPLRAETPPRSARPLAAGPSDRIIPQITAESGRELTISASADHEYLVLMERSMEPQEENGIAMPAAGDHFFVLIVNEVFAIEVADPRPRHARYQTRF